MAWWCVTRDDSGQEEPSYMAHGPYETEAEAGAFDDAVDYLCPMDLASLGVVKSSDEGEAVAAAKENEEQANRE